MPDTPARVGGRYELGPVLGSGGMADVRRAHDPVLGRDVAVKLLRTTDAVDRSRFASEARLLALLTHENVVTVLDAGVEGGADGAGLAWLALELVDGDTLADRFGHGPMDPPSLAVLGAQVAAALRHAHGHGVVHRDVKPSNVLIDTAGRARLTDFGIARLVDDGAALTMTGHTIGTAAYLAPEQVVGEPVTTASDVYALGLMLLEGLTGRREYAGPPVEAALARLHRSPLVPVSLPAGWPGLIATMTARQPDERPTADAVAERLATLARVGTSPARAAVVDATATTVIPLIAPHGEPDSDTDSEPGSEPGRRRPRWALVGVAAVMALVVALSALLLDGSPGSNPASAEAGSPASPTATGSPTPRATRTPTTTPTPTPAPVVRTPAPRPTPTSAPKPTAKAGTTRPRSGPTKGGHHRKGKSGSKGKGKGKGH